MATCKLKPTRRLGFQQLENRTLMAGNVTAAVQHHSLIITGDKLDNDIRVAQVAAGEYTVSGITTTVNGSTSAQTFSGMTGDVKINMNAGNDQVTIGSFAHGVSLPGNLKINLGSGSDTVFLTKTTTAGGVSITGSSGSKSLTFQTLDVGSPSFNSGKNDCTIDLPNGSNISVQTNSDIERDLTIKGTGVGAGDAITLDSITVQRNTTIDTSKNQGDNINVDLVTIDGNFTIDGDDPGSEVVTMFKTTIGDNLSIETGAGNDAVVLATSTVGKKASIETGAGDDLVRLGEVVTIFGLGPAFFDAEQISVNLGSGDDTLRLGQADTTHGGSYAGGKGNDGVFTDFTSTGKQSFTGFEEQGN
jgi:hypothetical protein